MVKRREKSKKEQLKLTTEIIEKRSVTVTLWWNLRPYSFNVIVSAIDRLQPGMLDLEVSKFDADMTFSKLYGYL